LPEGMGGKKVEQQTIEGDKTNGGGLVSSKFWFPGVPKP